MDPRPADGLVGFLSFRGARDQTMVIAFDKHSKVMCNFTADKRQLIGAIERIEAGDGGSFLGEAIMVAQAFSQAPGDEPANQGSQEAAKLMLFSDGRIADLDQIMVSTDELTFHCIGESGKNVGVTAMRARRLYEDPDEVEIFATVANYDAEPVTTDVQLSINDNIRAVRSVSLPAAKSEDGSDAVGPGKVAVSFSLSYAEAGVLTVRQLQADSLASDDAAWAVLAPPKRLTALLVTRGNKVLELALKACPLAGLDIMTPSEFDANEVSDFSLEQRYDVIVLDTRPPDMSGYECYRQLRTILPHAPVIFIARRGYDPSYTVQKARRDGVEGILYKPFRPSQLAEILEKVMSKDQLVAAKQETVTSTDIDDWAI